VDEAGDSEEPAPRRRLDPEAKAAVVLGLMDGARVADLARAHGVTVQAFRNARRRDAVFDAGWRAAHAASAEAERREAREAREARATVQGEADEAREGGAGAAGGGQAEVHGRGETRIACNNRRAFQRRKMRHVRFDERRRGVFLAHFAWSCDACAAAAEAGVSERTVYNHMASDPPFADEFRDALAQGYVRLEAEALRQRLAAQSRLRERLEAADAGHAAPDADTAGEFERVMKLLTRWDRQGRTEPGMMAKRPSPARAWTFDEAIVALEKRMLALGFIEPGYEPDQGGGSGGAGKAGAAAGNALPASTGPKA